MNPVRRSTLLAILLLLVPSVSAGADRVDGFIRAEMNARHIPGLSLCVVKDGHVIKAEGYGLANLELEVPATPSTAYEIGSMTKQFTAAAIMLLVEEGKIALDKPITAYLPELPAIWRGVKVRHVLTHTSGIEDHVALSDTETERCRRFTQPQMIALVSSAPLEFPPGSKWSYSNTGYFILGMMIERVSGETYGAFLQHRIFSPLGMSATRLYDLVEIIPHRAAGYVLQDGHLANAQPVDPSHPWASGGLLSSAADLAKWDAALYTERILRASSIKQVLTPVTLNDGEPARDAFWHKHYGFGWFLGEFHGHRFADHGGVIPGFTTEIMRFTDDRLAVIVLTNRSQEEWLAASAPRPWDIASGVARFYLSSPTKKTD